MCGLVLPPVYADSTLFDDPQELLPQTETTVYRLIWCQLHSSALVDLGSELLAELRGIVRKDRCLMTGAGD